MPTLTFATATASPVGTSHYPNDAGSAIPAGLTKIAAQIDLTSFPANQTCDLFVEWSVDSGATWTFGGGGSGMPGGPYTNPKSGQVEFRQLNIDIPLTQPLLGRVGVTNHGPAAGTVSISGVLT